MLKKTYSREEFNTLETSASLGDITKQAELGAYYTHRARNYSEAEYWLRKVIETGDADSQMDFSYIRSQTTDNELGEHHCWMLLAALNGNCSAQLQIGLNLRFGHTNYKENRAAGYVFLFASIANGNCFLNEQFCIERAKEAGFTDADIIKIKSAAEFFTYQRRLSVQESS